MSVVGFTIKEQAIMLPDGTRDLRYSLDNRSARISRDRYLLATEAGPNLLHNFDQRSANGLKLSIGRFALRATSLAYSRRTDKVQKEEAS